MSLDGKVSQEGSLAPESAVPLHVSGKTAVIWHCTPTDLRTLAAGWLVAEGIANDLEDVLDLRVTAGARGDPAVECKLSPAAEARLWRAARSEGRSATWPAGASDSGSWHADGYGGIDDSLRHLLAEPHHLANLFAEMFEAAVLRSSIGGVHTGGLVQGGSLLAVVEDVSRHHVVDRLVGKALASSQRSMATAFLLSSRISGAMARKACRAGIPCLVSRSIPSELAAAEAARCGVVLVGRARGENRHVHWPE